MICTPRGTSEK